MAVDATRFDELGDRGWRPAWSQGRLGASPTRLGPHHPVPAWVTGLVDHSDERDGRPRVLVTSYAGTRALLDLADGRLIGPPEDRPYASVCALVRIDGEPVIVSGGGTGHLQVSDLASGRLRWRRWCGDVRVLATAVLGGHPVAVLAGGSSPLQVWSLAAEQGERLATVRVDGGRIAALAAAERHDDVLVALGGTAGRVTTWRLTGVAPGRVRVEPVGEFRFEEPGLVSFLRFATWRGRQVLLGAAGRLARVWDAVGGEPLGPSFVGHAGPVNSVASGRFEARPAIWSSDNVAVRAWLPETGEQLGEPFRYPYEAALTSLTVVRINRRPMVVSGDTAGMVWVWEPEWPYPFRRGAAPSGRDEPPGGPGPVRLATVEFAGRPVVLVGQPGRAVRAVDPTDGSEVEVPVDGRGAVPLLVPGDRPVLAEVGPDGLTLREPATGDRVGTVPRPPGAPGPPDPPLASTLLGGVWTLLVAVGEQVLVVDGATGAVVGSWTGHSGPVHTVVTAELADLPVALTVAGDDTVRLWSLRSGRGLGVVLTGHGGTASAVTAATVDGRTLLFGADRSGAVRSVDVTGLVQAELAAVRPPDRAPEDVGPDGGVGPGLPEPVVVLTATGPVRSLAVVRSGTRSWLVAADGATLLWTSLGDDDTPRRTTGLGTPVADLLALPEALVVATADGLVGYRLGVPGPLRG
ncbi:hypothetical protein [Plantactinospora sp. B5E13]|uniref:WD40 repeat domain-containing protein n=1 Tax=Plantactinospora sp. B5E13 TaxID=3153758 RepID=UPI00325E6F0C